MGHSSTGRHGDGQTLYAPRAAWPPDVRAHWPAVLRAVQAATAERASIRVKGFETLAARPLRDVVADRTLRAGLTRVARRWHADDAEAAMVWASVGGAEPKVASRVVGVKLAIVTRAESLVRRETARAVRPRRVSDAVKLMIRTRLMEAVIAVPPRDLPNPPQAHAWLGTPAGHAFLQRALADPRQ